MAIDSRPSPEQSAYRDSRRAAIRILDPQRRHRLRRFLAFVAVALVVLAVWRWSTGGLPPEQRAVLFIFLLSIGLWATEAVPAFAVGLLIMGYLVFALGTPIFLAEPLDVSPYVNTFSSPVIWLMLGGFFMAEGLSRTGLDRRLLALAMRPAGDQPARVLLAVMLTSAIASMFISNTSTTALMIGAVLPLVRQIGDGEPFSKALLVGIPLAAAVGGMGTIIGSAPNAIAVGIAEDFGRTVDFVEWMLLGVPVALALVLAGWWLLMRRYRSSLNSVALDFEKLEEPALPGARDRSVVIVVTTTTIALWMTTPLHGIHVAAISLIPIVGLTMTQIMGAANVRGLPWDTLMLVAGGLSLGGAVVDTGLAERLTSGLGFLTETEFTVLVYAGLAVITVALSNFMSNTATVSVVLPMAVSLVPGKELELCLILGLSASCALLLPVSTPPNAVAFSTGKVETRDFRPAGILIGLLGPALIISWVLLVGKISG
jgi:sodium-dependent dicarboxylate transporter 2/3/5